MANKNYKQVYAKLFEYLALNRKILLVENDEGDVAEIILSTNAGEIHSNAEDIAFCLEKNYNEFKQNGYVRCFTSNFIQYSRENQTAAFSKKIKEIINK